MEKTIVDAKLKALYHDESSVVGKGYSPEVSYEIREGVVFLMECMDMESVCGSSFYKCREVPSTPGEYMLDVTSEYMIVFKVTEWKNALWLSIEKLVKKR